MPHTPQCVVPWYHRASCLTQSCVIYGETSKQLASVRPRGSGRLPTDRALSVTNQHARHAQSIPLASGLNQRLQITEWQVGQHTCTMSEKQRRLTIIIPLSSRPVGPAELGGGQLRTTNITLAKFGRELPRYYTMVKSTSNGKRRGLHSERSNPVRGTSMRSIVQSLERGRGTWTQSKPRTYENTMILFLHDRTRRLR